MRQRFERLPLVKMIIVSAILFFLIVIVIDFVIEISRMSMAATLENMLSWKYFIRKFLVAVVYGIIIGIIYKRKQKKVKEH